MQYINNSHRAMYFNGYDQQRESGPTHRQPDAHHWHPCYKDHRFEQHHRPDPRLDREERHDRPAQDSHRTWGNRTHDVQHRRPDRQFDTRPSIDGFAPYRSDLNPYNEIDTVRDRQHPIESEMHQLLQTTMSERVRNIDTGITANDVRTEKYGRLSPSMKKELANLDINKDYRLVTQQDQGEEITRWEPTDNGQPVFIQSRNMKSGATYPWNGSTLLPYLKRDADKNKMINEGITSNDFKKGIYGELPFIRKTLDALEQDKNYTLTRFMPTDVGDNQKIAWVDSTTGKSVPICALPASGY